MQENSVQFNTFWSNISELSPLLPLLIADKRFVASESAFPRKTLPTFSCQERKKFVEF